MIKLLRTLCLSLALMVAFSPLASAIAPITPGTPLYLCYQASIVLDYDCDGSGDVGWNEGVSTYQGCLNRVQQMVQHANTYGFCYWFNPTPNCTSYTSARACRS